MNPQNNIMWDIEDNMDTETESNVSSILKFHKNVQDNKYNQKWNSILEEDNISCLATEMTHTLLKVSCYITKIDGKFRELTNHRSSESSKKEETQLKEFACIGRELLTKLKLLAMLEKATAMEKYEQPRIRKMSYAATEDTLSCADTESVTGGRGGLGSSEESIDRKDSQVISLSHHYAISFTRRYETFNRLNHNVEEIIDRLNEILDRINSHLQFKFNSVTHNIAEIKKDLPDCFESTKEPILDIPIGINLYSKSALEILAEHLEGTNLNPSFRHINVSGTGHLTEYIYSCSFAGLYAEGKGRKKSKAKEDAAIQMLKLIMKKQKNKTLPSQIPLLSDFQLQELTNKLDEKEDFIDKLEEECLSRHEQPPLYTILSEVGKYNEPFFTIKCEALGFAAIGHGNNKLSAKKNTAKSILSLITKRRKSQVFFQ